MFAGPIVMIHNEDIDWVDTWYISISRGSSQLVYCFGWYQFQRFWTLVRCMQMRRLFEDWSTSCASVWIYISTLEVNSFGWYYILQTFGIFSIQGLMALGHSVRQLERHNMLTVSVHWIRIQNIQNIFHFLLIKN